jgi:hypothetical protein
VNAVIRNDASDTLPRDIDGTGGLHYHDQSGRDDLSGPFGKFFLMRRGRDQKAVHYRREALDRKNPFAASVSALFAAQ